MNRYITQGILGDLAAGRSVLVVSPSLLESGHAHGAVLDRLHADALTDDEGDGYAWSLANGGQWVRDEHTKAAATFVSIGSAMVDHATGDVIVLNGWRRMIDRNGLNTAKSARLRALTHGRDTVVID